jgi:importin subunit beta-1
LETLGYLCCDVKPEMQEMLQKCSSQILTAICSGLVPEASPYVRLAAITAMLNSLEFVSENFKRSAERDYIMQYVCQNSVKNPNNGPPDLNIRTRAHECLVKIISLYYEVKTFKFLFYFFDFPPK